MNLTIKTKYGYVVFDKPTPTGLVRLKISDTAESVDIDGWELQPAPPAPGPNPPPGPPAPTPPPTVDVPQIASWNFTVPGSNSAALNFPETARLEHFGLVPGGMTIRTTGTEHWPELVIESGGEPVQAGTLWVLERIGGTWYATGAERLRKRQLNGDKPEADPNAGGLSTLVGNGWLYAADRWGPMAGHNPKPGDIVGVMVVAGSTRSDDQTPVKERTNPIWFRWPDAGGANPVEPLG